MILLRLLNGQGLAGLAASLCLALLLVVQKGETRHWHKQSDRFEQLHADEASAHAQTVANYRAAAADAEAADRANANRIAAKQSAINERSSHDFEARLAIARVRYDRLQHPADNAADAGTRATSPMSRLSAAAGRAAESAGENRLPASDALLATEQAIQLDELISWIKGQSAIDPNGSPPATP